jgi:hypothetical protein
VATANSGGGPDIDMMILENFKMIVVIER